MSRVLVVVLTALLWSGTAVASDEDDAQQARRLVESGRILPLQTIIEGVLKRFQGRILEVGLEMEDGHPIYEVELLEPSGRVRELHVDAETGRPLERRGKD